MIGILDPDGKNVNPFNQQPYSEDYKKYSEKWRKFPMYEKRDAALKIIKENQVILIISGTGSGKTVLTPKFALHTLNYTGKVIVTNPKRTPTKANAAYAALCMDVKLGTYVGMKYRDSDPAAFSDGSRLIYATDGWVCQKLQQDISLKDYDCVIIDEAHERNIQIDMLLLLLKQTLQLRPTFKLIIMSATVNEKIFTNYYKNCAVLDAGEVPNYPIKEHYATKPINKFNSGTVTSTEYIDAAVAKAVEILTSPDPGDILIFFPSKKDTADGCFKLGRLLEKHELGKKVYCNMLTSTTDKETEDILTSATKYKENGKYEYKIIFATEVAESSITFDGLKYVIDTGLVNNNSFDSARNMTSLDKQYISKASHKQRRGRTGRTAPGVCYNLFTEDEYRLFLDFPATPISTDDISENMLYFLSNNKLVSHVDVKLAKRIIGGSAEVESSGIELYKFLEKLIEYPPKQHVHDAIERLIALGAIGNSGKITELGMAMAKLGLGPERSKMLISSKTYGCIDEVTTILAALEVADMRMDALFEHQHRDNKSQVEKAMAKYKNANGDHFSLIKIFSDFMNNKTSTWCKSAKLHYGTLCKVDREKYQMRRKLEQIEYKGDRVYQFEDREDAILAAILDGFCLNLAKKVGENYINCFPRKISTAKISKDSLLSSCKSTYYIYTQLKSIFGNKSFSIVCKISQKLLDQLIKNNPTLQHCVSSMHGTAAPISLAARLICNCGMYPCICNTKSKAICNCGMNPCCCNTPKRKSSVPKRKSSAPKRKLSATKTAPKRKSSATKTASKRKLSATKPAPKRKLSATKTAPKRKSSATKTASKRKSSATKTAPKRKLSVSKSTR